MDAPPPVVIKPPPVVIHSIVHDGWINSVSIVFGYLWLISGLNKVLGTLFVSGFSDYLQDKLATMPILEPYKTFLEVSVVPHSAFFAYAIEYTEVLLGATFLIAGVLIITKHAHILHYVLGAAYLVSLLLIVSIILTLGYHFPFVDLDNAFDEGVNLDFVVLFISFFLTITNFQEAWRERPVTIT